MKTKMKDTLTDSLIGGTGIVAANLDGIIIDAVSKNPPSDWIDAIISVIIAVITLFGLFKRNKKKQEPKK